MRFRRNAQSDREMASDDSTPPDVLDRLSHTYPREVAGNPNASAATLLRLSVKYSSIVAANPTFHLYVLMDPELKTRAHDAYTIEYSPPIGSWSTEDLAEVCERMFRNWGSSEISQVDGTHFRMAANALSKLKISMLMIFCDDDEEPIYMDRMYFSRPLQLLEGVAKNVGMDSRLLTLERDEKGFRVDDLLRLYDLLIDHIFGRSFDFYSVEQIKRNDRLAISCTEVLIVQAIIELLPDRVLDKVQLGPATLAFCNRYCDHRIFGKYRNNSRGGW